MGYDPAFVAAAGDLIGNSTASLAYSGNVGLDPTITMDTNISALPASGKATTGAYTILVGDWEKTLVSTDATGVTYTLPAGFTSGFRVRSYQGAAGQITYAAGVGATLINIATPKSGGLNSAGYYAELENLGDDKWIVVGSLAP